MPGFDILGGMLASTAGTLAGGFAAQALEKKLHPVTVTKTHYKTSSYLGDMGNAENDLAAAQSQLGQTGVITGVSPQMNAFNTTPSPLDMGFIYPREQLKTLQRGWNLQLEDMNLGHSGYQKLMLEAANQINKGTSEANQTLQPLSGASNAALGQMMQMLGVNYNGVDNSKVDATDILTKTPGYKFALQQGQEAINRGAAATHTLNSANTQIALQQRGQELAKSTYDQYMSNLGGIAQLGMGATTQQAANQIAQGTNLAGLAQAGAQETSNFYNAVGTGQMQYAKDYNTINQNAQYFNANALNNIVTTRLGGQYQVQSAAIGQQGALAAANVGAMNAQANLMNAQTNANQLSYNVFQNQQGGQSYYDTLQANNPAYSNPAHAGTNQLNNILAAQLSNSNYGVF